MVLDDLKLFLAITDARTLSAAARLARTTPSTVSRRMTALEQDLGAKLLNRTTRRLTLTDEGMVLLDRIRPLLSELDQIRSDLREAQGEANGVLRVSASIGFGGRYIAPLVGEFRRLHPKVLLDLRLEDERVNLNANEADVAVRVGRMPDSALRSVKLASLHRVACASPAYLDCRGRPAHPEALVAHECIIVGPAGRSGGAWRFSGSGPYNPEPKLIVSSHEAAAIASVAGAGVAHLPLWMVATDLRDGRLERILDAYEETSSGGVYLLWQERPPAKVRAFVDFLRARIVTNEVAG
jgi:DNA-binding transcriptional LysR family regulator